MRTTKEVIFRSRDLSAVKEYYADRLGLPIVLEKDGMIGFSTGALNFYFEQGAPTGPVFEFVVDDEERAKNDLVAAGCIVVEENSAIPRTYLRDRFGVVFNITEELIAR